MGTRLHFVGRKNHGKTTLVAEVVGRLTELGYRIGTIKHTHHRHELDTPGKDSHCHRAAGAQCVGILSPQLNAAFWSVGAAVGDERYAAFDWMFASCDLVVVEGDTRTRGDKVEVWRAVPGDRPLAATDGSILAMVTDDQIPLPGDARFPRHPIDELLQWIVERYLQDVEPDHVSVGVGDRQ